MNEFFTFFQNELASGNFSVCLLILAFFGGILASLSPCSLGILPIIVGYIGGYDKEDLKTTLSQLFFFVLGMSVVLSIIGVICALTGKVFASALGPVGVLILTSFIMLMGLNLLGLVEINVPVFIKEFPQNNSNNKILYPFLIGAIFALAASPCSTPILASVMAVASLSANLIFSICLLLAFALGQGVIIILVGMFTSIIKNFRQFASFSETFLKFCGIVLVLASLYMYYKVFSQFI
ncbi:hypothetical protein J6Q66_08215 [bacterium]|nr:hypothetical protein [bacterium]